MQILRFYLGVLAIVLTGGAFGYEFSHGGRASLAADNPIPTLQSPVLKDERETGTALSPGGVVAQRYRLEASQSKFIAHAVTGGLLWFKGHDHLVQVREFTGEARFDPEAIGNSSLDLDAKAASMEETSGVFTEAQKKIINGELRDIVLLPKEYPDIIFKSTSVTGKAVNANEYDLKIAGNLTLHGVTKPITIPTKLTITGDKLNAQGQFDINRSDFKVKATSAMHGLIRVKDNVKFRFDIVGHRL